jgi:3-phenylpropionate/trans-cinnamate dioxygenase ferredoxin reductase component
VPSSVLIVGGGLAAQRAAETLRARDHRGPIRVVCGEPVAPYDRPPLSKELRAEPFRPVGWYEEQDVELLLGRRAAALDVRARRVWLEDGAELAYDDLIVATGARPRRLPMFAGGSMRCARSRIPTGCEVRCSRERGSPSSARGSSARRSPRPPAASAST